MVCSFLLFLFFFWGLGFGGGGGWELGEQKVGVPDGAVLVFGPPFRAADFSGEIKVRGRAGGPTAEMGEAKAEPGGIRILES